MTTTHKGLVVFLLALVSGASMRAADNVLANPGFESPSVGASDESGADPASWTVFSSVEGTEKVGLSTAVVRSGKQAARFTSQGVVASYQGLFQSVPVSSGRNYTLVVYVRNDKTNPLKGPAMGQLSIEWLDAHNKEIDRAWGPTWGVKMASSHWGKFEMTSPAPPHTSQARLVILQFDGKTEGGGGSYLVDDVALTEQP